MQRVQTLAAVRSVWRGDLWSIQQAMCVYNVPLETRKHLVLSQELE